MVLVDRFNLLCVHQIKTLLDAIKTPFDAINASCLACDLRLEMTNLSHDMPQCGFERGDARLELCHISFKLIDNTPNVPEMLKDDIVRLVSHNANLARSAQ